MSGAGAGEEETLEEVLELVAREGGRDLREYARGSLRARLAERSGALGLDGLTEYARRLRSDKAELAELSRGLLVHATGFFRDPAVYRALEGVVLPSLRRRVDPRHPIRAWSVGCASGEEAWSLALVLAEALGTERQEVLATDRDAASIERAREARYPAAELLAVPGGLRARWFEEVKGGGLWAPRRELRQRVAFAVHDLVGPLLAPPEAVIGSFELVACRNVLLYLEPRLRAKALGRLASVVAPGGVLLLGVAEEAPPSSGFRPFEGVEPGLKIYDRRDVGEDAA